MFAAPKLRRLMEDESLRELVCSKLNLGLETKLSEDEFVKEVVNFINTCRKMQNVSATDERPIQSLRQNTESLFRRY